MISDCAPNSEQHLREMSLDRVLALVAEADKATRPPSSKAYSADADVRETPPPSTRPDVLRARVALRRCISILAEAMVEMEGA